MADRKPRTGELTTANYGWTKPTVGASDDQWGGYLNADLDGIDGTVKGVSNVANAAYPASNPAGYVTAAAIPAPYVLPTASTTVLGGVKVDGTTITIASGTISGAGNYALPPASTTVLGGVKVDGTTIKAAIDGTISTTVVPLGDNRIINGDMRIDQRNGGVTGTGAGYTIDRWYYNPTTVGKMNWRRGGASAGFGACLLFTSTSTFTLAATDTYTVFQAIEADMLNDIGFGAVGASPMTLSFWVNCSLIGTFGGSIRNDATTRSYPFSYSIPVANTWTKIIVTIPGDTAGTWTLSGNGAGMYVAFDLGSGSNLRGPANAWASVNYVGATGTVSPVATNAATFYLTGVKLEIGSVATPYPRQSLAKSMADCQRYYSTGFIFVAAYGAASSVALGNGFFPVSMRAAPTIVPTRTSITNVSGFTTTFGGNGLNGFYDYGTITAAGNAQYQLSWTASAEL